MGSYVWEVTNKGDVRCPKNFAHSGEFTNGISSHSATAGISTVAVATSSIIATSVVTTSAAVIPAIIVAVVVTTVVIPRSVADQAGSSNSCDGESGIDRLVRTAVGVVGSHATGTGSDAGAYSGGGDKPGE
jgi:hypothetical protein